jgi:C-terminal processing protease CtpA/Prc
VTGTALVVVKVFPGSIAMRSGLKKGDVIVRINNNPVKNVRISTPFMVEGLKRTTSFTR